MPAKRTPSTPSNPSTASPLPSTPAPRSSASATTSIAPSTTTTTNTPSRASPAGNVSLADTPKVALEIWNNYVDKTPQRAKLIDAFMAFLIVVGAIQFVYCVVAGNYPFNAFLSGFSATVGQFVLTASLRIQTNPVNKAEFGAISHERAFADFVFGSLILHFFCINFIN